MYSLTVTVAGSRQRRTDGRVGVLRVIDPDQLCKGFVTAFVRLATVALQLGVQQGAQEQLPTSQPTGQTSAEAPVEPTSPPRRATGTQSSQAED